MTPPRPATDSKRRAWRFGRNAETLCAWVLRLKGYQIVARDFRVPVGEIDIVARRGRTLAFIEVKARGDRMAEGAADRAADGRRSKRSRPASAAASSAPPRRFCGAIAATPRSTFASTSCLSAGDDGPGTWPMPGGPTTDGAALHLAIRAGRSGLDSSGGAGVNGGVRGCLAKSREVSRKGEQHHGPQGRHSDGSHRVHRHRCRQHLRPGAGGTTARSRSVPLPGAGPVVLPRPGGGPRPHPRGPPAAGATTSCSARRRSWISPPWTWC